MVLSNRLSRLRKQAGSLVVENLFRGLSAAGRLHPASRPESHQVEVLRDVPYLPTGRPEHTLDLYRPVERPSGGRYPVLFYVHGGGFRILSKDTHWIMALAFARRGFLVVNINYRLSPRHPFPAAVEDACAALTWAQREAAAFGGDMDRLVLAGESAGANLATTLALCAASPRQETYARALHAANVRPRAVVAACGMLQVSDTERFARGRRLSFFWQDRLNEVRDAYLQGAHRHLAPGAPELELADPLTLLEGPATFERPLPPFFAFAGTGDVLMEDTQRLAAALEARRVRCKTAYYPDEPHAFHALVFRPSARHAWRETFSFLEEALGQPLWHVPEFSLRMRG